MTFKRFASIPVQHISTAEFDSTTHRIAFKQPDAAGLSHYKTASGDIDVGSVLKLASEKYAVSADPGDYIYEAVRALTAEEPNQNGDAFPRSELLRFDTKRGCTVFQTFIGKPHHINHRADNPKAARGVVIDAYYNDSAPALERCKACNTHTADEANRDGINCKKCGALVKDEFVELLLAVDTKKDPTFADGVRTGALSGLSMGCDALYTDCSICGNRARSVRQFCSHIKSGKKKQFKTASGMRMAFEKCGEVEFTEISRVDQPADPTARQREIFSLLPQQASLEAESSMLIMASRIASAMNAASKDAQMAQIDQALIDQLSTIRGTNPELHRKLTEHLGLSNDGSKKTIDTYAKEQESNVDNNVTPGEIGIKDENAANIAPDTTQPTSSSQMGPMGASIEAKLANANVMNIIAADARKLKEQNTVNTKRFAKAYGSIRVGLTDASNVTVSTPKGSLFLIRPESKPTTKDAGIEMCREILASIAAEGLLETMDKYKAIAAPKMAQVLENAIVDFASAERPVGDRKPSTELGVTDGVEHGKPPKSMTGEESTDAAEGHDKPSKDTLADAAMDHAEQPSGHKNLTDDPQGDMASDERGALPKSTISDPSFDHDKPLAKGGAQKVAQSMLTPAELAGPDGKIPADLESDFIGLYPEGFCLVEVRNGQIKKATPDVFGSVAEALEAYALYNGEPHPAEDSGPILDMRQEKKAGKKVAQGLPKDAPTDANPQLVDAETGTAVDQSILNPGQPGAPEQPAAGFDVSDDELDSFLDKLGSASPEAKRGMLRQAMAQMVRDEATALTKKYATRLELLMKSRIAKTATAADQRVNKATATAVKAVEARYARALKLAARRQLLNLEFSPVKSAMFDTLVAEMDLGQNEVYSGMDDELAARLVEAATAESLEQTADTLIKRASEFAIMSDDAFNAIEADVKNLRPLPVSVAAATRVATHRDSARTAAVAGNMPLAPSPAVDAGAVAVPSGNSRENIRSVLGATKVGKTQQNFKK